ncbi:MAG: Bax inhibitor-1/YccA family protein [Limnohabitans sp.]|jgi:modulator of FtsH protease|uniref:Bax inhibitor-1/YccA family protein n=1 Tax=Limnohabitans sp. TaxID=1907725 RepID=UPI0011D4B3A9|nr:MAG: Bax inhibitor-1/YccA family protein [Limnohabitans sp.]
MSDIRTLDTATWGRHGTLAERNRVLRNTYWLLALSLVPTVLGAWLGVATGITASLGGGLGLVVFLAGAFGFMFAIEKTKNSATGVPVLLGFTFFMGLMLSRMIAMVLGFKNGSELVMTAFAGTAGVFFVMASLASTIKRDLSGIGKWLFVGAIGLMIGGIVNVFVGSTAGMMVLSTLAIVIFSAYMLFDLKQIVDGGETNYISATLALYLDIFNVFQSLLALLGIMGGERD